MRKDKTVGALKRWRIFAIVWPFCCIIFAVLILCDSSRNTDERIANVFFTIIPLIFFAVGMRMRRRLLKERKDAIVMTKAVVVSIDRRVQPGKQNYFPVFEFQADGVTHTVKYSAGYSFSMFSKGDIIDLYYNPENPETFYVPAVQKHDNRLSLLLCAISVIWPLLGLLAPLIQTFL